MIALAVNLIPFNKGSIFSPAYLKHNSGLISCFEADVLPDRFPGGDPLGKLRDHLQIIKEIRNEILISTALKSPHDYNLRSKTEIKIVRVGDLCLYTPTSIRKGLLARVLLPNNKGSSSVYVQLARGKEFVELRYLFIIVRSDSPAASTFDEDFIPGELSRSLQKDSSLTVE